MGIKDDYLFHSYESVMRQMVYRHKQQETYFELFSCELVKIPKLSKTRMALVEPF